ncbi:DUF397 domain-containing protein [Streptomyces sp. NPDC060131]|uniref:DUF397 domain-containing protein n=1 Tax=unclassified Streptomyces TaxID=2593676 RepID=UPI00364AE807
MPVPRPVEVAELVELVDGSVVRDSKDPGGALITFRGAVWRRFVLGVREGRLGARGTGG